MSGVSFANGISKQIGKIHLSEGAYLVFATVKLDKAKVEPGNIADVSLDTGYPYGVSASLSRYSTENIITVGWELKTLAALRIGNSTTDVWVRATIYGGNLQVDAIQCTNIYAVRLR